MERYLNRSANSGVFAFEIGSDFIKVKFTNNAKIYTYSYRVAGRIHVENMKQLAYDGSGLNSYIKRYVNSLYDR